MASVWMVARGERWEVRYRVGGRGHRQFYAGRFDSIPAAERRMDELRSRMAGMELPARRPTPPESRIYFISGGGLVKIGRAVNISARLANLQTGSPEKLRVVLDLPGGAYHEKRLHEEFAEYRRHGEWFDLPERGWRRRARAVCKEAAP